MISQNQLFDGIAQPRPPESVDIELVYVENPDIKCREIIRASGGRPVPMIVGFYLACANLPSDAELSAGQRPWCRIYLHEDTPQWTVEHEREHCYGWRDVGLFSL
jgi:hypothetical protein